MYDREDGAGADERSVFVSHIQAKIHVGYNEAIMLIKASQQNVPLKPHYISLFEEMTLQQS